MVGREFAFILVLLFFALGCWILLVGSGGVLILLWGDIWIIVCGGCLGFFGLF